MKVWITVLVSSFTLSAAALPDALVAHEWGTFTSVANENGRPVNWAPWSGSNDLPCFVAHVGSPNYKFELSGLVRMETPVLYFYTGHPQTLFVHVEFPHGWITEWYPKASVSNGEPYVKGKIDWNSIEVLPGSKFEFPDSKTPSHYYAARNTDSAPLRVGDQQEKLLFYRGVGGFQVPLRPKFLSDGKLEIRNAGPDPIQLAIVFENRDGKVGYRVVRGITDVTTVDPPKMTGDLQQLQHQLASELAEFGLYKKEAEAMVETWRDSWFEDGTRVLYLYPRGQVDALLPLTIQPSPASTSRVYVGRVEVLSPWSRNTIQTALSKGDVQTLTKFGRFLEPFIEQMHRETPDSAEYLKGSAYMVARQAILSQSNSPNTVCKE